MMKEQLKDWLREYKSAVPLPWHRGPTWRPALDTLKWHGLTPRTVFDVGVAQGTFQLYRAFPDAHFHLIDPANRARRYLDELAGRRLRHASVWPLALGDMDGEATFEERNELQGSTFLPSYEPTDAIAHYAVPVRRFDTLFAEPFERPALVKIDVQGFELQVLRGMTGRMASVDALIVEVSTIATLKGGPEVSEVVNFMTSVDFVVADVLEMKRRRLDHATAQLDLMFLPAKSPARQDRRWG